MSKNISISVTRVFAMLLIIIGHYFVMVGIYDYQLTGVGVEIFLLISGYLYNGKEIGSTYTWLKNRIKRIFPAYWLSLLIVILLRKILGLSIGIKSVFIYLFCLQGADRILINLKINSINGIGQTWFLTVLMVCYFLIAIIKNNPQWDGFIRKHRKIFLIGAIVIQIVGVYIGIQIVYILCFFIGYFWDKSIEFDIKKYITFSMTMFFLFVLRILCRRYCDGTALYDHIIARWTFILLAVWLFLTIDIFCKLHKTKINILVNSKIWVLFDMASYPLYLVHFMFVNGEFATKNWCPNIILASGVFTLLTFVLGSIVMFITQHQKVLSICKGK